MFSIENNMFSIENNINKNQCFSQNIQCGSNIKDREGRDMDVISQTWCPVRLFGLELSGTNFFRIFDRFWQILAKSAILRWILGGLKIKKIDVSKKKVGFQKVKSISITVTKYEPLTPKELGAIQNLPKIIFLMIKKMISGNSLSFLFKAIRIFQDCKEPNLGKFTTWRGSNSARHQSCGHMKAF